MNTIIIFILVVIAFLIYAGYNAVIFCDIIENYNGCVDYFKSIINDTEINIVGKVLLVIFNLLFPITFIIVILVNWALKVEEKGCLKNQEWFRRIFKKNK